MPLRFSGSIYTLMQRTRAAADRVTGDVLRRASQDIYDRALAEWPVDSGRSRRFLTVDMGQTKGRRPRAIIRGGAGYTTLIRSKGRKVWETLVVSPSGRSLQGLPRAVAAAIMSELSGSARG